MKSLLKYMTLIYMVLLTITCYPVYSAADEENWWDVVTEEDISSPYYNSIHYCEIAPLLHTIAQASDRVDVSVIGKSSGGRNLFLAVIASTDETQGRLGYYKEIRKLMRTDPTQAQTLIETKNIKVPVFINCSIHGDEYPGTDAGMRIIQRFAYYESEEIKEILDNVILLVNVVQNPDGRVLGTRHNGADIDINRDFLTISQPESLATINVVREWNPMVFLDLHGFMTPMLIEPCTAPHLMNAEYDLFIKWALPQAEAMGEEVKLQTGYEIQIPFRDWPQYMAWDDWAPSYAAVYAILTGAYGHTIETPYTDERGVDADYAAVMGALKYIAKNKNAMLSDQIEVYRRGFRSEAQQLIPDDILNQTDYDQYNQLTLGYFPAAYVIPSRAPLQKNPHACFEMITLLLTHGIEVKRSTETFTVDGTTYPEDTYIVWMNQPKRALANTILENGLDLSSVEGGLVFYSQPTSWSVPLLWGVSLSAVSSSFDVETANVYKAEDIAVTLTTSDNPIAVAWLPTSIDAYKATGELIYRKGISVRRAKSEFTDEKGEFPVGTFIITIEDAIQYANLLINTYHLDLYGLQQIPEESLALKRQYIGIVYDPDLIYCLDLLNIDYKVISSLDQLVISEETYFDLFINSAIYWSLDPDDPYAIYKTELGESGRALISKLFAEEKDYIGFSDPGISLPVEGGFVNIGWNEASGSDGIISIDYDSTEPVGAGFDSDSYAYVNSPIWFTEFGENVRSVADIASGDFFISGYWPLWESSGAEEMAAIVHSETGNQDTVLIGIDPVFRCHPKDSFRLIANAIYSCQE